jgi:hypothetical protein
MKLDRQDSFVAENFQRIFGKSLPHMDTVDDVLVILNNDEVERLKALMIAGLIEKKVCTINSFSSTELRVICVQ